MMRRTLYEVLMVHPGADRDVISVVYRHLAKRYHPDRDPSPAAQARMAELNEAYEVLNHPDKRARYDEILSATGGDDHPGLSRARARPAPRSQGSPERLYGEAGPPPPNPPPTGSALPFGRYLGWTLSQVARYDRDYLEWLQRAPAGLTYKRELQELLNRRR